MTHLIKTAFCILRKRLEYKTLWKCKVGGHLLFVPPEQAQVLLGQKEKAIKVLVA